MNIREAGALSAARRMHRRHTHYTDFLKAMNTDVASHDNVPQEDTSRGFLRKGNRWNLFQRGQYLGKTKHEKPTPTNVSATYRASSADEMKTLNDTVANFDAFKATSPRTTYHSRWGPTARTTASDFRKNALTKALASVNASVTGGQAQADVTDPIELRIAEAAMANSSNKVVDDVLAEAQLRVRALNIKRRELHEQQVACNKELTRISLLRT